jgi:hypothetical protein
MQASELAYCPPGEKRGAFGFNKRFSVVGPWREETGRQRVRRFGVSLRGTAPLPSLHHSRYRQVERRRAAGQYG